MDLPFIEYFLGTSNIEMTIYVFYVTRAPREQRNSHITYGTTYFRLVERKLCSKTNSFPELNII